MRIWTFSDTHVDADPWRPSVAPRHDVCVIAGDVRDGLVRSIAWITEELVPLSPLVVYCPGNHDYYGHRWQSELARGREAAAAAGIVLLAEGEVLVHAGVRFVGATLWTDYAIHGEALRASTMAVCGDRLGGMRDHRRIRVRLTDGATNAFRPAAALAAHVAQRARITAALAEPHAGPTVVVTHHAPSPRSLCAGEVCETIDAAYASDLSAILESLIAPELWIHGHLHRTVDYRAGGTRVVSNARGHVEWRGPPRSPHRVPVPENPGFIPDFVLEI